MLIYTFQFQMIRKERETFMRRQENRITTDVLVIGGGFAGVFAALEAKKQGLDVTLVDKGGVGKSGQTPWTEGFHLYDPETSKAGREEYRRVHNETGLGMNNLGFLEHLLDDSMQIFEELTEWGAVRDPRFGLVFAKKVKQEGIRVFSRTMLTHLIKKDQRVIGAMGFALDDETTLIINAKAVINCAGAGSYKAHGFPIQGLTFDGDAISYRAGAEISGKEFNDFHPAFSESLGSSWFQWGGMWGIGLFPFSIVVGEPAEMQTGNFRKADRGELPTVFRPPGLPEEGEGPVEDKEKPNLPEVPAGIIPALSPPYYSLVDGKPPQVTGGSAAGLGIHKAEGVFPKDGRATYASCVEGLYAAGDSLASMLCGATYSLPGIASAGSCSQGKRAGAQAAEYAKRVDLPKLDEAVVAANIEEIFAPLEREQGYDPAWVIQQLQNTMIPYYTLYIKEDSRLEAALTTIEYLRKKLMPKLQVSDSHGLKLAHETGNMLLNAEMRLRASLMRTETRGTHIREDCPEQNDEEWLHWVVIREGEGGQMQLRKHPVTQYDLPISERS
jgi:succinate dehydrogenase/fumarate reductase flavoprotein subunit